MRRSRPEVLGARSKTPNQALHLTRPAKPGRAGELGRSAAEGTRMMEAVHPTPESDHERIQGTWRSVRIETLGYCADEDIGTGSLMVFAGDRVTLPDGMTFRFRLDPAAKPKQLDLLYADTEHAQFHAIYAIERDRLVTCFNTYLSPRPASFSTSEDVSDVLTHFERACASPAGGQAEPGAAADGGA